MRIAICAGEPSGDIIAAGLIKALRKRFPDAEFIGVAGPLMCAAGCQPIEKVESLSVMGIVEVLKQLPRLLKINRAVTHALQAANVDLMIGVDAPDFNLPIEKKLKQANIPTVHYVSPTVWAWRKGRIKKIKQAVDLMLTLFPFESACYEDSGLAAKYVGHPLADALNPVDSIEAKASLNILAERRCIALMPGSRTIEIKQMGPLYLQAALLLLRKQNQLQFIIPAANKKLFKHLAGLIQEIIPAEHQDCFTLIDGQAEQAINAAEFVIVTSGTATLEVMLLNKPMVVAYKMSTLSWWLCKWLVTVKFCSLPNLLENKALIPELLQHEATPENIAEAVQTLRSDTAQRKLLQDRFSYWRNQLKCNASEQAALAVVELLHQNK